MLLSLEQSIIDSVKSFYENRQKSDWTDASDQEGEDVVLEGLAGILLHRLEPVASPSISDSSVCMGTVASTAL